MFHRLRGLVWLALLVGIVVGVPVVVHLSGVLTPPEAWPSAQDVIRTVRQGTVSDDAIIGVLAVVVSVAWLRFTLSAVLAVWCSLRRVSMPRVVGLGGSTQRWATSMVAGVTLLAGQHGGVSAGDGAHRSVVVQVVELTDHGVVPLRDRGPRTTDAPVVPTSTTLVPPAAAPADAAACAPLAALGDDGSVVPGGAATAVLLAGGALATVEVRRRARLRSARPGARLLTPAADVTQIESRLRALTPVERLVRLDVTLRAVAATLIDRGVSPAVQVLTAVVHDDGRVDITLSGDAMPAAPFDAISPDWWRLAADVEVPDVAPIACRVGHPSPALVHLGAAEGGELFVDVEALGVLCIDAAAEMSAPVMRMIVASLCASPFSGAATIVSAGVDPDLFIERPRAEHVVSVDAALDLAAISLGSTTGFTTGGMTTSRLRAQSPGEGWEPAVVLIGPGCELSPAEAADVVTLTATPGRGLAVICDRDIPGARWRLSEAAGMWTLQPLGMVVRPAEVSVDEVESVRRLLRDASAPPLAPVEDPLMARRVVAVAPGPASPPYREQPWSLVVRLLGPVSVETTDGVQARFDKARSLELVTWLAVHRERPSRSGARSALWEADVRDATFANVVSEARRALARTVVPPADTEWLGRTLGETLPLHAEVVTDAELLEARLVHARRQTPSDAVQTLRGGLAWVRGLPFADTGYLWPDGTGTTSRLVLLATTAATEMAQLCLDAGDIEGVFWATGKGLAVLSGHEELVGLRMRAHADRGDLAAVRQEWDSYLRALSADATWGDAEPAHKLVALRHQLLGSTPRGIELEATRTR